MLVCVLALAAVTFSAVLFSPPTERQLSAGGAAEQAAPIIPDTPAQDKSDNFFGGVSGDYDVTIALSVVQSDDPDMLSAAESIRGELFSGILSLSVDESGTGTALIQQMFFTPETISVSPFADSDGVFSQNTLYGYLVREGIKLSVVCVCEEDGVSGFIWMDSAGAHIEFLYYSS